MKERNEETEEVVEYILIGVVLKILEISYTGTVGLDEICLIVKS